MGAADPARSGETRAPSNRPTRLRWRAARWLLDTSLPWRWKAPLADLIGGPCPVHGEPFSEDEGCEGWYW